MTFGFFQTITYWSPGTPDGYGGLTYGAPVSLTGRWEERQEQFLDKTQTMQLSQAIVFLPNGTSIEEGGYLYLGTSIDTDPTTVVGAFMIKRILITPDLRSLTNEVRAVLQ